MRTWLFCLGLAAGIAVPAGHADEPKPEELTPEQRKELEAEADRLFQEGVKFYQGGKPAEALKLIGQELELRRQLYGKADHADVANSLNAVGSLYQAMGRHEEALPLLRDALAMYQRLYKDRDHLRLATSLNNMGFMLQRMGRNEEALPLLKDALAMRQRLYKDQDHPDLAGSLTNMGLLLREMGRNAEALPFHRDALAMLQHLHEGRDHPQLATGLNNMGVLLQTLGQHEQALPFYKDALVMRRGLFKGQDHPELAISLSNMGSLLQAMGRHEEGLPFFKDALAMLQRMHEGRDHPHLAQGLNNMGGLLKELGQNQRALPYWRDALAMLRRLHESRDHPHLAHSLDNMGTLLQAMGRLKEALPFHRDALAMEGRIAERSATTGGLPEALALVASFPDSRASLLSASERVLDARESVYESAWATKAGLARLFRTRRALAHADRPKELEAQLTALAVVQRQITGLIPQTDNPDRDRQLSELNDDRQKLEAEIAALLPAGARPMKWEVADLSRALLPAEVFIDFYRYKDWAAAEDQRIDRYVAFLVAAEGRPRRVELGESEPIDAAISQWVRSLNAWEPGLSPAARRDLEARAGKHAAELSKLLWRPIAEHVPTSATRLYFCPDGDLGRVPFAALPGKQKGTVLLERYAIASVESGSFLVEHRKRQKEAAGPGSFLAVGGVRYTPEYSQAESPWPYLEGSAKELDQVVQLWGGRGESATRSGQAATTDWLLKNLPDARFAHLATHGEFRSDEYSSEQERIAKAKEDQFGRIEMMRTGSGAAGESAFHLGGVKNPLGYVGVVMAGANDPPADSPDRGILAGTSIWGLDLSNMELAVLSACETGLGVGDRSGAAGVQNLAMAFHVAGCDNVVTSLWKVDDEATAALMARFYHELWENGKPPIEALREAQLLVYRRPKLIPDLVAPRGAPRREEALAVKPTDPPPEDRPEGLPDRLPAKYWAAFTLSGVGD